MEKRIFVAVVISIAFLALWSTLIPKFFPQMVKKPAPVVARPTDNSPVTPTATTTTSATRPRPANPQSSILNPQSTRVAPVAAATLQQTFVDTPEFVAVFSNRGAEL